MAPNLPEFLLLKFLPLTYHHSHFLAATLDFASFFTIAFLRAALFFLQLGCFGLDICIYMCYDVHDIRSKMCNVKLKANIYRFLVSCVITLHYLTTSVIIKIYNYLKISPFLFGDLKSSCNSILSFYKQ